MMSKLEKEFYKRFNNQRLSGDDFDADGLWDDISNELDTNPFNSGNSFWRLKWASIFGAVLIFGGAICFAYSQIEETAAAKMINETVTIESNSNEQLDEKTATSEDENLKSKNTLVEEKIPNRNIEKITSKSATRPNENSNVSFSQIGENQNFNNHLYSKSKKNSGEKIGEKTEIAFLQNEADVNQFRSHFRSAETTASPSKITLQNSTKTDFIDETTIPIWDKNNVMEALPNLPNSNSLIEFAPLKIENTQTDIKKPTNWNLEIIGGSNLIDFKTKSFWDAAFAQQKDDATKLFPGTSFGLHLGYQFYENWLVNSGVEYHQLRSKFDYIGEREIFVPVEDQLFKVWISETTGDTLKQLRGDTVVRANEIRTVVHFNKYDRLSIPIEFGIRKQTGKLIYGISTGVVFNYTIAQSGKSLNPFLGVVEIESEGRQFTFFDIGLRLRPVIGFQFNKKLAVTLQPQYMWSRTPEILIDSGVTTNNHQYNLNLGIGYSF